MTIETREALKEDDELPILTRASTVEFEANRVRAVTDEEDPDAESEDPNEAEADPDEEEEDPEDQGPDDQSGRAAKCARARKARKPAKRADGEDAATVYTVALSSEYPVERWFGTEILEHSSAAIDLERASGMPVLADHDPRQQIGVVERMALGTDKKLRADIRFSRNPNAQLIERDVADGIRRNISVGYMVNAYDVTEERGKPPVYRATSWSPMELSIVSVPADPTVGVGRSADGAKFPVHVRSLPLKGVTEVRKMTIETPSPSGTEQAAAIVRLATMHGMSERAADWLAEGKSIDQVREIILDARSSKPAAAPNAESGVVLTDKERKQYSYARAIASAADMAEGKRATGFEAEISEQLERDMPSSYKRHGGLYVPTSMSAPGVREHVGGATGSDFSPSVRAAVMQALTRAGGSGTIDSVTANYIKEVVFTEYGGELIEILRNIARTVQMGATVLTGLTSPVAFPRQTQDVAAYWVAENSGSDVTAGNVKTDLVTLNPKTLQGTTAYSRQLLVQSSVDVEAMVRMSMAASHALAWDLAALHGTGASNQPTGIYSQPGVLTHDFSADTPANKLSYAALVDMETQVANNNALLGTLGWLTTPGGAKAGKTTLQFAVNGAAPIWTGTLDNGEMDGYTARATNQVSKTLGTGNDHGLIFGNWADLLIGQFGGAMELIVDPYSKKKQGLIEVTSFQMCDIAVRHAQSFCVGLKLNP